jgi:phage terminase large subunit
MSGTEFFFAGLQGHTIDSIKSFEGVDDLWIEEGQSISKYSLDILIPTIRKDGSQVYISMNRMEVADPIYQMFILSGREDVLHIKINYYENNFCPEILKIEAEACRKESEEDYQHIYEGEPITQGDKCILSLTKVRAAQDRTIEAIGGLEEGVDVARFGDDKTVITVRRGFKVLIQKEYSKLRTYEVAEEAIFLLNEYKKDGEDIKQCPIKVDDTGVGGGVTDELFKQGYLAIPVNNAQKAKNEDKYDCAITEMFYDLKEIIDEIEIPNDQGLLRELTTRQYTYDKKGRKVVESKDKYKARYKKSPDKGDSLLLCFYSMYSTASITFF